ncbi:MAG: hypothetical protein WC614_04685 [bacterium]
MNTTMSIEQKEIVRQAQQLTKEKRKEILMLLKETELHKELKILFEKMEPNYTVEITHGVNELGKDLVIVNRDRLTLNVIGVVVKRGNISGKTLGEVDEVKKRVEETFSKNKNKKLEEIESQVSQAFSNSANMKTIFMELPVHKVFIVLAGDMSNTAKTRLEGDFKERAIDIFDIEWLINNFTEYYPQIFFEGETINFFQTKIENLEKKYSSRNISLSEYFVEPLVAAIDIPAKFDEEKLILICRNKKMPFSSLKSILSKKRKIILTGDPGVGKSSNLAKLSIDMLRNAYSSAFKEIKPSGKKIEIPILMSAKEVLEANDYKTMLGKFLGDSNIIERFKVQVILVDALDEVLSLEREKVIKRAEQLSLEANCSLVITSRKINIIETLPSGFEKYELLPFELGQALKLFEKLVSNKQILDVLKNGLEKINFQIPMVPLSLMLLIQLVEENKEIPASVTELYDRFFDMALGRYDKEKGIEVLFDYIVKKRFFAKIAIKEFLSKNRLKINRDEYEKFLDDYVNEYSLDKEILSKELERVGILDIRETVTFRHRTFLDYSAAFYIYDKWDEFPNLSDFIVEIYFEDIWGDVAFFYIGLRREVKNDILDKIFNFEKGKENIFSYTHKFLVGRLIQAGWNSSVKTRYYGLEKAIAYAPEIRGRFLDIVKKGKIKIPRIFADFIVMDMAELSFGSMFLFKEAKQLFNEQISKQLSEDNLYMLLSLLWSIKRFYNPDELPDMVNKFLLALSKCSNLGPEEQSRILLFLMHIEVNDSIAKTIRKRLNRLSKRYPEIFRAFLPCRTK